jgi:hypothetical protein
MKKGLLLGAGFSYDLGMPLSYELTDVFLGIFNDANVKRLAVAMSGQQPYGKDRPINKNAITNGLDLLLEYKKNNGTNYEIVLAGLQNLKGISCPTQSDRDSYHYLFVYFYDIIHQILCLYQKASYEIVYAKNKEWFSKLENLLSDHETWIFSLNHDLYCEYLALDFNIPITYGDDETITFPISNLNMSRRITFGCTQRAKMSIDGSGYFKSAKGINLVKVHGGISELEYRDNALLCNLKLDKSSSRELALDFLLSNEMAYCHGEKKIPGGKDRTITNLAGELDIISQSMLTGGRKYSRTSKIKEGEEKLQIFDDALRRLDQLTIIGYGFGDDHINFRISNALLVNGNLKVVIVDPFCTETPDCIKQFDYDSRIRRAACGAAHWMDYCVGGTWNMEQMNALKENCKLRTEVRERVQSQIK